MKIKHLMNLLISQRKEVRPEVCLISIILECLIKIQVSDVFLFPSVFFYFLAFLSPLSYLFHRFSSCTFFGCIPCRTGIVRSSIYAKLIYAKTWAPPFVDVTTSCLVTFGRNLPINGPAKLCHFVHSRSYQHICTFPPYYVYCEWDYHLFLW